ncbi:ParA family protein [Candidatus Woesearchaeota archaeon]|jgi:chromosome partitioning protein|nr:ParA family protein [Candidatus Woesearchaeota archaeon]MBT4368647.1 ParA family protein [Candidatus Woesearchaeota archaeon]MBT4712202.1 ParA family protein [Candidatus Woesearchaeota archaeon]MBT6638966.1 ParA family protein [Candidatus Woesearchaeota archaeon]MBT7134132.1 ParA family protein [Candidatus Woesearchaeota archaeon]
MRKICIINQKGGVGKTTTTINLGAGLSRKNKKVLIIDLDAQGNIDSSLNLESYKDVYDFLFENAELNECIAHVGKNLDIMRSKETLTKSEIFLAAEEEEREFLLKRKLEELDSYDYVLVDCPPSLGLLNQNAMLFADEAIIPVSTDFLGMDALRKMAIAIKDLNQHFDHTLKISKVVPTMFDKRTKLSHKIMSEIQNEFYNIVTDPIRVDSKLKECPLEKKSIFAHAKSSKAAKDYMKLVTSLLRDEKKK